MRLIRIVTMACAGLLLGACASVPPGPGRVSVSAGTMVCSGSACPPGYPYPHSSPYRGPGVYGAPNYYGPQYYGAPPGYGPAPGLGIYYRGRPGRFRGFR